MPSCGEGEQERSFNSDARGDQPGLINGIIITYGVIDHAGDVFERHSVTQSIREHPVVPLLWEHHAQSVIGVARLREAGDYVRVRGEIDVDDPEAVRVFKKVRKGLINGLSVAFEPLSVRYELRAKRNVRVIEKARLWEVSVVTLPAHPGARVTDVRHKRAITEVEAVMRHYDEILARLNCRPESISSTPRR